MKKGSHHTKEWVEKMTTSRIVRCKECNREFRMALSNIKRGRKFCSRECMGKWNSKNRVGKNSGYWKGGKIKKVCLTCHNAFSDYPSVIKKGRKFCSKKCGGKDKTGDKHYNWRGGKIKRICIICGKEFYKDSFRVRTEGAKFCSSKCMGIQYSKDKRGNKSTNWKGGLITTKCLICNTEFKTIPSRITKCCSKKCCSQWRSRNWRGENNIAWKGGIKTDREKIRASLQYKKWRQDIFIRDHFTCQKCGKIGGYLEAHHKKAFILLLEEAMRYLPLFSIYDSAILYTPLWDITNGQTLCKKCHDSIRKRGIKK